MARSTRTSAIELHHFRAGDLVTPAVLNGLVDAVIALQGRLAVLEQRAGRTGAPQIMLVERTAPRPGF